MMEIAGILSSCLTTFSGLLLLLVILLITLLYLSIKRPTSFPPGPRVLPLVGSLPFLNLDPDEYIHDFMRMHRKYGDIFSIRLGKEWYCVIQDYETLKELFVRRGNDIAGRPQDNYLRFKIMNPEKDQGVLFGDYSEQWKLQRNVSMVILRNLGYGKNRLQEIITEEAEQMCHEVALCEGAPLDIMEILNVSVANVICSLLFGERYDHSDTEFRKLRHSVDDAFKLLDEDYELDFLPVLRFLPHYKGKIAKLAAAYGHMNGVLKQKIRARTVREDGEPRDFIEGYLRALKHDQNLDDRSFQITQDFFQAGMETTTTTLGWGFYFMLKHPEIQNKVQQELDQVVGQSRSVTLRDKENLPYTEACVAEIMRLSCTAPMTVDHKVLVDSEISGYRIPKGTVIWGNLWAILRNPEVFPEPETFRPERFIMDDGSFKRHEQLINFSIGRRSCLGEQLARQELFLFFTHMLQKFEFSVPEGHTHPPPKGQFALTHRSPNFKLVAKPRI